MKEIVVISGKGGTGKTSIVASFAALAKNAVLADCDVDAADLHLILDPDVQRTADFSGGKLAYIITDKCIGCGECLAVCRFGAVKYDLGRESAALQKSMAEHALGAVKDKQGKAFYLNCLIDMTRDCDCAGSKQKKLIPDLGILASDDPVAIDKATLDLTREVHGKDIARLSYSHFKFSFSFIIFFRFGFRLSARGFNPLLNFSQII